MSSQTLTPEERQTVDAIYIFAAQMMKQGAAEQQIEKALIERGLPQDAARVVIANLSRVRRETRGKAGMRNMGMGAVVFVIGLVITLGSYASAAASPSGGSYMIAYGAIIFGAIQFFQGLWQVNKA